MPILDKIWLASNFRIKFYVQFYIAYILIHVCILIFYVCILIYQIHFVLHNTQTYEYTSILNFGTN